MPQFLKYLLININVLVNLTQLIKTMYNLGPGSNPAKEKTFTEQYK